MKTFWTEETVNKNADKNGLRQCDWLSSKRHEFEVLTGVRWSICPERGGFQFHPVDDGIKPVTHELAMDFRIIDICRHIVTGREIPYVSYLEIFKKGPDLNLRDIMEAVRDMEKRGLAMRTVDRMGKGYAFKILKK
jgi:hypothetical protein